MQSKRILLEICVESAADAFAAADGGAGRIELCSALTLGGLTPSYGTLEEVKRIVRVPVVAMIRPRESGFCYSDAEFATMCRDAEIALELGAEGIVVGCLDADGRVHTQRCRRLKDLAADREVVFHRAFDVVREPIASLETLVDLGFTRILTSGQRPTAVEGEDLIRRMIDQAAGRIEILPGGGLTEANVADFVRRTGCRRVHMGLSTQLEDPSIPVDTAVRFGGIESRAERLYRAVDVERVRRAVSRLG